MSIQLNTIKWIRREGDESNSTFTIGTEYETLSEKFYTVPVYSFREASGKWKPVSGQRSVRSGLQRNLVAKTHEVSKEFANRIIKELNTNGYELFDNSAALTEADKYNKVYLVKEK